MQRKTFLKASAAAAVLGMTAAAWARNACGSAVLLPGCRRWPHHQND